MDNRKIILILCVIIAIIAICFAAMFLSKEKTIIEVSNETIFSGDSLTVNLTDSNGNPIADQNVSIMLKDQDDGTRTNINGTTDSDGKVKLTLVKVGDYDVEVKFDGNGKYESSSAEAIFKVNEK